MKRALTIAASVFVAVVGGAGAVLTADGSAEGQGQCRPAQGEFILTVAPGGTVSGTAKGEFRGTVSGTFEMDFTLPNPRHLATLQVTTKDGTPTTLTMDFVATNFTTPGLVGGGVITKGAAGPGDSYYNLTASMAPGWNTPMEWAYSGERCIE